MKKDIDNKLAYEEKTTANELGVHVYIGDGYKLLCCTRSHGQRQDDDDVVSLDAATSTAERQADGTFNVPTMCLAALNLASGVYIVSDFDTNKAVKVCKQ